MAKRILLVDDDIDYRTSMTVQLQAAGYEVLEAEGVEQARQIIQAESFDAAIVDLMMEETDGGFSLCYDLKQQAPDRPVIMVSAVTSETGINFGAGAGEGESWIKADAFLAKPVRFEQLQGELARLLKVDA